MKQTATERMKEIERALAALPAGYFRKSPSTEKTAIIFNGLKTEN